MYWTLEETAPFQSKIYSSAWVYFLLYDLKLADSASYFVPRYLLALDRVARLCLIVEPAEHSDAKKAQVPVASGFRSDFARHSPLSSPVLSLSLYSLSSPFPQHCA